MVYFSTICLEKPYTTGDTKSPGRGKMLACSRGRTLAPGHCVRFFAYIWPACLNPEPMYPVGLFHSAPHYLKRKKTRTESSVFHIRSRREL